jgi:hypothetical protein
VDAATARFEAQVMGKSTWFAIDFAYDNVRRMPKKSSESDKFKEATRELESVEDEFHWMERLKRIVKAKPEKSQ